MKTIPVIPGRLALVDDEDYARLIVHKWFLCRGSTGLYAYRNRKIGETSRRSLSMHRQIILPSPDQIVDHVDRDGLNNQKHNLRLCSKSENMANSGLRKTSRTGFKGVYFQRRKKSRLQWTATISTGRKSVHLGWFASARKAAEAYDSRAKSTFDQFALTNRSMGLLG